MRSGDGKTFKEAVNELIRMGRYHKAEIEKKPRKPFKVKAKNMGVFPHLNYNNISVLLRDSLSSFLIYASVDMNFCT